MLTVVKQIQKGNVASIGFRLAGLESFISLWGDIERHSLIRDVHNLSLVLIPQFDSDSLQSQWSMIAEMHACMTGLDPYGAVLTNTRLRYVFATSGGFNNVNNNFNAAKFT